MTNPTPHGQVPDALNQLFEKLEDCIYEWSNYVRADDAPTTLPKYTAGAIKDLRVLVAELYHRATHVQNPAEIEHVAGDVSKNWAESNMSTQQTAPAGFVPVAAFDRLYAHAESLAAQLLATPQRDVQGPCGWIYDWTHSSATGKPDTTYTGFTKDEAHARKHDNCIAVFTTQQPAPATQQAGEVRPVTPYTCPKCHALWLHWPAEQTGFGRDTLNCRSADHCHYCEKASVEQLQRLERIPAALHAPQPSPTAQAAESVLEDAARWQMAVLIGNEVMLHPDKRSNPSAVKAYMDAVHSGLDFTGAVDAARKQGANHDNS